MKEKLIDVLSIQTCSHEQERMVEYITKELERIGCEYYMYNGCIYVSKGKAEWFPCVVAHMDGVHDICEDLTVMEIKGNLTGFNTVKMEQTGIGGDDKVGVYIALQCLEHFDNIKIVFFRDEETGCEGSYDPDEEFFKDCGFVLQCDRQGYGDFITKAGGTQLSGEDFQHDVKGIIKSYSYEFKHGSMTDVMALKESGIECAMANISCGYYNPHMDNEYVNINHVEFCLAMVKDIIIELQGNSYVHKYTAPKNGYKYDWYDEWDGNWDGEKTKKSVQSEYWYEDDYCECCREPGKLRYIPEYNIDMCEKCIDHFMPEIKQDRWAPYCMEG